MYRGAFLVVAACGFHGPGLTGDGGPHDGLATVDAPPAIDAPPDAPPCTQHPSATHAPGGAVGGGGGSQQPAIACAGNGIPVGLALDVTQAPLSNHGNQPGVVAIHVRCGTIVGGTTFLGELFTSSGGTTTNCTSYLSPILGDEKLCPPGAAIVAIDANELDVSLYNSVVVTCSDGTMLPFPATGAHTNLPQHAACAAGTVVAAFDVRAGCGQDQLALECAALSCQ